MGTIYQYNFRQSAGSVDDTVGGTVNGTYIIPGDNYPTSKLGLDVGLVSGFLNAGDFGASVDRRLKGAWYFDTTGTPLLIRIELDKVGLWGIRVAMGHPSTTAQSYVDLQDDTTPFKVYDLDLDFDLYYAADGVDDYTPAAWPANNVQITHTFTSTTLRIAVGLSSPLTQGFLNHIEIEDLAGGGGGPVAVSAFNQTIIRTRFRR